MKQLICLLAIALTSIATSALARPIQKVPDPVHGEYIVMLNDDAIDVESLAQTLTQSHGGHVIVTMRNVMKAFGARMTEAQAIALADHPLVKRVEENAKAYLSASQTFTDNSYWHLDRLDDSPYPWQGSSYLAYNYTSTGEPVDVYVLDTGVLGTHEQFQGRVLRGIEYGNGVPANNPCDGFPAAADATIDNVMQAGHGTAVASVIAGNFPTGGNGVAKAVTLIPVKVWNNVCVSGGAPQTSILWWCYGLDWIYGQIPVRGRKAVVNISGYWFAPGVEGQMCPDGTGGTVECLPALEHNIVKLIRDRGAVVVTSANNQNNLNPISGADATCQTSPARMGYGNETAFPNPGPYRTITVGGLNAQDQRWVRSLPAESTGCDTPGSGCLDVGSNYGPCVSIYAAAHNFLHLAHIASNTSYRTTQTVGLLSGTSFSAPIVSGMAARILQTYNNYSPAQVWSYVQTNAVPVTLTDRNGNSYSALRAFMPPAQ